MENCRIYICKGGWYTLQCRNEDFGENYNWEGGELKQTEVITLQTAFCIHTCTHTYTHNTYTHIHKINVYIYTHTLHTQIYIYAFKRMLQDTNQCLEYYASN